jgi:hypothetical protein
VHSPRDHGWFVAPESSRSVARSPTVEGYLHPNGLEHAEMGVVLPWESELGEVRRGANRLLIQGEAGLDRGDRGSR